MKTIFFLLVGGLILFGLGAPPGDAKVFLFNAGKAGWMVSVDAVLFQIAVLGLVNKERRPGVVACITLAHAFYGFLGLGILTLEQVYLGIGIAVVIAATSYAGIRFIVEGLTKEEVSNPHGDSMILNAGLLTFAAIALYSGVSIDELFAVLQRYQWMVAQGWDHEIMAYNIALSMVVLYAILWLVDVLLDKGHAFEWAEEREEEFMFTVFALIMYYIIRAIAQNGAGYVPWEIPWTGIAPDLLIAGFFATWVLQLLLKHDGMQNLIRVPLLLGKKKVEVEA